jgi:GNAT superfamily N-acetyltransferase
LERAYYNQSGLICPDFLCLKSGFDPVISSIPMEIRPPHKPNYPAIAEMLGEALGQAWNAESLAGRVMADQHFDPNLVFMAREQGVMLGFLATVLEGENAWIKLIAVHPSRRGQGLGREMLERAQERLFGEGARVMRAGFGPGPLFYPGVPEGIAEQFFAAVGYESRPGGTSARILEEALPAGPPDAKAARALIEAASPLWWSEAEERLTFKVPRLAMSSDRSALCLAEPGLGIGPLFAAEGAGEASISEAVKGALSLAEGGRALSDFRGAEWWQKRFKLEAVTRCLDFQKDLRGVLHA